MPKFNKRAYGVAVIKSINSNYNADFTHQPRTLPDGRVYATDKALKYLVRNYLIKVEEVKNILFFKNLNDELKPKTLDETYKQYFGEFPKKMIKKKSDDSKQDEYVLFSCSGSELTGFISEKPKTKQIKDLFKSFDEDNPLSSYTSLFSNKILKGSYLTTTKFNELFREEDFEGLIYFDKGKPIKIEEDTEDILKVAEEIDNLVTGGLDRKEILGNLLKCLDVRIFGGTYAGSVNLSIHGPVQITHGLNQFVRGEIFSEQIMSPFRNSAEGKEDSAMTTLGTQSKLREGHYVHGISVNPKNLEVLTTLSGTENYLSLADIDKLKLGLRRGATYYDSSAKAGTDNELLLWVELKEGSKMVLPSFAELVKVLDTDKREIDLSGVQKLLAQDHVKGEIEKVEVYYNKAISTIVNKPDGAIELDL